MIKSPARPFHTNARIVSVDRYERAFTPSSGASPVFHGQSGFNPLRTSRVATHLENNDGARKREGGSARSIKAKMCS